MMSYSAKADGVALVRTMLQAAGQDPQTTWLLWSRAVIHERDGKVIRRPEPVFWTVGVDEIPGA